MANEGLERDYETSNILSNRTTVTEAAGWRDTREYERLDDAGKLRGAVEILAKAWKSFSEDEPFRDSALHVIW